MWQVLGSITIGGIMFKNKNENKNKNLEVCPICMALLLLDYSLLILGKIGIIKIRCLFSVVKYQS